MLELPLLNVIAAWNAVRLPVLSLLMSVLFGCASAINQLPELDRDKAVNLLVVGHIKHIRYLDPLPECADERNTMQPEGACAEPPPIAMRMQVWGSLSGQRLPDYHDIYTTNSHGIDAFGTSRGNPYLFHVLHYDGVSIVPEGEFVRLARDKRGRLGIPMLGPDDVPTFLPCWVKELHEPMTFRSPVDAYLFEIDDEVRTALLQAPEFVVFVENEMAATQRGIPLAAIAAEGRQRGGGPCDSES